MRILEILEEFLKELEKKNKFNLILKGGTALSLYHLDRHRESEDLDFDADKSLITQCSEIEKEFLEILSLLKSRKILQKYRITKSGFAASNRYHIKLELTTHKTFYSKIDLDFVDLPQKLIKKDNLNLYTAERMFVGKSIAFINRKEFKDIYDISHLIAKL